MSHEPDQRPFDESSQASKPPPSYKIYRSRPGWLTRIFDRRHSFKEGAEKPPYRREKRPGKRNRSPFRRVLLFALLAVTAWLGVSLVLFLISAQIEHTKVSSKVEGSLSDTGFPPVKPNTVLFLGSDQRPADSKEPGASSSGPSRSDTILLMRIGGGHNSRLSIPRDTVVNIPGHGLDKINAAYAIGGPELTVNTVSEYLGIEINHLIEIDFERFPKLIDALGGVDYSGGCVVSRINGGYKNGGYTLRLKRGTHHINGKQALALARTRKNDCNPRENDLTRARRQQKIIAAVKSRLLSPGAFIRLPWVAWRAPQTARSDMAGPALLGTFIGLAVGGGSSTQVLKPSGSVVLPNGGVGLSVDEQQKTRQVKRFLSR